MRGLASVREGWDQVEQEETRLLRQMSVHESVGHLLALYRAFEPELLETESLYRADRIAYLVELQSRLLALDKLRGESD